MRIALGQHAFVPGNIDENIKIHLRLIEIAIQSGADAIFFPELSLTSYEPELAQDNQLTLDDERLKIFRRLCQDKNMVIGVGAPVRSEKATKPLISMLIFQPNQEIVCYSKQILHSDEYPYFSSGEYQVTIQMESSIIGPAICYESLQPQHYSTCKELGVTIFLASVAKSQEGLSRAEKYYESISEQVLVLCVNGVGPMDNFVSCGGSGVWKMGKKVAYAGEGFQGCLVYDIDSGDSIFSSVG
jgi:predicted amidohydrolase